MKHNSEVYSSALNHFLPQAFRVQGESLFRRSAVTLTPVPAHSQALFHSILGPAAWWCPDWLWSWSMAVAGLLSQYWIYNACTSSFLVWNWRCFSLSLSSHSSVYSVQPLPDPVNVWSVSSHTCSLNSDPWVKKLHLQRTSPFFFKYTILH